MTDAAPRAAERPADHLPSVLIVHNRYRHSGGEDVVVEAEHALLAGRGHRVERFEVDNNDLADPAGVAGRFRLARETIWSRDAAHRVATAAQDARADVVHIHNFVPQLSPAIHGAARATGAAVVQTLHNYRLVCPAATLLRDGRICRDCLDLPVALPAVVHRCYRESVTQTAVVAAMLAVHRVRRTWTRDVDAFIALSPFMARLLAAAGLPGTRIHAKSNFVERPTMPGVVTPDRRSGVLFVGRLAPEKGLRTLIEAWRRSSPPTTLRIVGDGPLRDDAEALAAVDPNVTVVGGIDRDGVVAEMARAAMLVVPSVWYEGPLVIMEAFAAGLPVVASDLGPMRDMIEDGRTGRLAAAGDPDVLAAVMGELLRDDEARAALGRAGRAEYEAHYTADANYPRLLAVYTSAIDHRRGFVPT